MFREACKLHACGSSLSVPLQRTQTTVGQNNRTIDVNAAYSSSRLLTLQERVQPRRCLGLQPRRDVAVDVQRDAHTRVSEALADDFRVHTLGHQQTGAGVSEVVEAKSFEARHVHEPEPPLSQLCSPELPEQNIQLLDVGETPRGVSACGLFEFDEHDVKVARTHVLGHVLSRLEETGLAVP